MVVLFLTINTYSFLTKRSYRAFSWGGTSFVKTMYLNNNFFNSIVKLSSYLGIDKFFLVSLVASILILVITDLLIFYYICVNTIDDKSNYYINHLN